MPPRLWRTTVPWVIGSLPAGTSLTFHLPYSLTFRRTKGENLMAVDATPLVGANSVTGAIRKAAQATGTSFDYLLATARVESDLNPNLTMRSSTATGLFQFIEQTWLGTLKQAGPAFGYGTYANAISQTASGRYVVADPALRNEI